MYDAVAAVEIAAKYARVYSYCLRGNKGREQTGDGEWGQQHCRAERGKKAWAEVKVSGCGNRAVSKYGVRASSGQTSR